MYGQLKEEVRKGSVNVTTRGALELFCYSKECFFGMKWNDVTRAARGLLYYNGIQVNHPFPKIFNVDEVPETQYAVVKRLMNEHQYYVLDKANGHLFIASYTNKRDVYTGIVYSTKGSLPHEDNPLLASDIELWKKNEMEKKLHHLIELSHSNKEGELEGLTLCFEVIAEHDKHTLYEEEVKRYGTDQFVLLGGYYKFKNQSWKPISYNVLRDTERYLNCPVVKLNDPGTDIKEWFDHKNTEGYVIWFPGLDFRVKVKTKEYWAMRFKKDLTTDNILQIYLRGGSDRLRLRLPEEVSGKIIFEVEKIRKQYIINELIGKMCIPIEILTADFTDNNVKKELYAMKGFTQIQKDYIVYGLDHVIARNLNSRKERESFVDNLPKYLYDNLDKRLKSIVDEI